jgi:LacI family transcriptional regulator
LEPLATLTLDDLAKRANVSPKTISRVVNKLPGVGAKKRAEIEALILQTGFRPNFGARVLASSRSYIVCMVVEEQSSHYYFSELQVGISRACISAGYHLIVEPVGDVLGKGIEAVRARFAGLRPDGFIVVPPVTESLQFLEALKQLNLPFVRIAPVSHKEISSYVGMDDEQATYEITKELIGLGHRDIAWLSVTRRLVSMQLREAGFRRAMSEAGLHVRGEYNSPAPEAVVYDLKRAYNLMILRNRPTAIVCGNDSVALYSVAAAQKAGLVVPHDVSIVGFDDSPGSESCWPPLTTVAQPISAMGQRATELLFRHLERDQPLSGTLAETVDFSIVRRMSAAKAPEKKKRATPVIE